jgi:hypothetical protein
MILEKKQCVTIAANQGTRLPVGVTSSYLYTSGTYIPLGDGCIVAQRKDLSIVAAYKIASWATYNKIYVYDDAHIYISYRKTDLSWHILRLSFNGVSFSEIASIAGYQDGGMVFDGTYLYASVQAGSNDFIYVFDETLNKLSEVSTDIASRLTWHKNALHAAFFDSDGYYMVALSNTAGTLTEITRTSAFTYGFNCFCSDADYLYIANRDDGLRAYSFNGAAYTSVAQYVNGYIYGASWYGYGFYGNRYLIVGWQPSEFSVEPRVHIYRFDGSTFIKIWEDTYPYTDIDVSAGVNAYFYDSATSEIYTIPRWDDFDDPILCSNYMNSANENVSVVAVPGFGGIQ